jgi:hypothetical protein
MVTVMAYGELSCARGDQVVSSIWTFVCDLYVGTLLIVARRRVVIGATHPSAIDTSFRI